MERLRTLRKECGKTQKEVAEYLKITQSGYQNYEIGDTEPNIDKLIKLADYYQVSIDYLVGRNFTNDVYLTGIQKDIVKALLQLNEFDQAHIYGQIIGMLAKY